MEFMRYAQDEYYYRMPLLLSCNHYELQIVVALSPHLTKIHISEVLVVFFNRIFLGSFELHSSDQLNYIHFQFIIVIKQYSPYFIIQA